MINLKFLFIAIAILVAFILPLLILLPIKYLIMHCLEKSNKKLSTPIKQLEDLTYRMSTRELSAADFAGLPEYMRNKSLEELTEMLKRFKAKYTRQDKALNWIKIHFTDRLYNDSRNRFYRWLCLPITFICLTVAVVWLISVIELAGSEIYTYKTWNYNYEKYTTMQEPSSTACVDAEKLNEKRDDFLFLKKEAAEELPIIDTKLMWKKFNASVKEQ